MSTEITYSAHDELNADGTLRGGNVGSHADEDSSEEKDAAAPNTYVGSKVDVASILAERSIAGPQSGVAPLSVDAAHRPVSRHWTREVE